LVSIEAASLAERLTRVQKVWCSNPGPTKFYTALQTVRHRFNIYASSCIAVAQIWAPPTLYTIRRNMMSIMKGLVLIKYSFGLKKT